MYDSEDSNLRKKVLSKKNGLWPAYLTGLRL